MSQVQLITQSLKQMLKANNLRYGDIAKALNLSEASVKRLFASNDFTLERLDKICALMNMELSDLFSHVQTKKPIIKLQIKQEETIAADIKLLIIATCVVNHWTLSDILSYYNFTYHECIQRLAILDKMKLIELLPKDRFKLIIAPNFSWIPHGPIQQFFQKNLQDDYLKAHFSNKDEFFTFRFGMLSEESNAVLRKKLQNLVNNFTELSIEDASYDFTKRRRSVLLLALRPWTPQLFENYKKV